MTALELFTTLQQCGAVLTPMVTFVRIDAPPGAACPVLLRDLLDLLELYGERAAIGEVEAGLPREHAERLAWEYVLEEVARVE